MVYCPCGPSLKLRNNINKFQGYALCDISNEFTPIGEPITMWASIGENKNVHQLTSEKRTISVIDYSIEECASIIPCFGIESDIYNTLVQRYSKPEHPLSFPTQTLSFYACTRPLKDVSDK